MHTSISKSSSYYIELSILFVGLLLTANIIGEKPLLLGSFIVPAGLLLFPLTYLLADIITEVYGLANARRIIWMGAVCNLFMAFMCNLAIHLPCLESWEHNEAYATILGESSRLIVISVITYFISEFLNAYIVAKLKRTMQGNYFWFRALCANWIGVGIETTLFVPLAFYGKMSNADLMHLTLFYYSFKTLYAICAMPFISQFVHFLKKKENLPCTLIHEDSNL